MSDRITIKNLEALADRLNVLTNSPRAYFTELADGKRRINVGYFHIDQAYGGVQLVRTVNEGGGITNVLSTGHVTKRELFNLMHAYLRGMEDCKNPR